MYHNRQASLWRALTLLLAVAMMAGGMPDKALADALDEGTRANVASEDVVPEATPQLALGDTGLEPAEDVESDAGADEVAVGDAIEEEGNLASASGSVGPEASLEGGQTNEEVPAEESVGEATEAPGDLDATQSESEPAVEILSEQSTATSSTKLANTLSAKAKTGTRSVTYSPSTGRTVKNLTVSGGQGTITYTNASANAVAKTFTVNKQTGAVRVPKGVKVGTYTVKISVRAAGNSTYKAATKTVSFKIKVLKAENPMALSNNDGYLEFSSASNLAYGFTTIQKGYNPAKSLTFACPIKVSKAQGAITYKIGNWLEFENRLAINPTSGYITVPEGLPAGSYYACLEITAAGNANYKEKTQKCALRVDLAFTGAAKWLSDRTTVTANYGRQMSVSTQAGAKVTLSIGGQTYTQNASSYGYANFSVTKDLRALTDYELTIAGKNATIKRIGSIEDNTYLGSNASHYYYSSSKTERVIATAYNVTAGDTITVNLGGTKITNYVAEDHYSYEVTFTKYNACSRCNCYNVTVTNKFGQCMDSNAWRN